MTSERRESDLLRETEINKEKGERDDVRKSGDVVIRDQSANQKGMYKLFILTRGGIG